MNNDKLKPIDTNAVNDKDTPSRNRKTAEDAKKEGILDNRKDEKGGRDGKDPTRYGDWEKDGRAIDF
jgi:hypothetical protein